MQVCGSIVGIAPRAAAAGRRDSAAAVGRGCLSSPPPSTSAAAAPARVAAAPARPRAYRSADVAVRADGGRAGAAEPVSALGAASAPTQPEGAAHIERWQYEWEDRGAALVRLPATPLF